MFKTLLLSLKRLAYDKALNLMRGLAEIKTRSTGPEVLIITEHEPVLTMGRRADSSDILVDRAVLDEEGISVHRVERGGLITYHGPGQLVAYPVFNLRTMSMDVGELVHGLEEVVLDTLFDFGIKGERIEGRRGVWVKGEKIASVGVAVRRSVSFHGVALNCDPDLSHFEWINPCGMNGIRMTSMARILNEPVDPEDVRDRMTACFKDCFRLDLAAWSMNQAMECITNQSFL